jgi:glycosyltransferase involved in cell wall biosynthesis
METKPLVSVIIATYNRADLLIEAIGSVRDQLYNNLELIVADDGSTDETRTRVAALDTSIHYLGLDHSGRPSVARNRALSVACGEFVAFLDDDDLWRQEKLLLQVALFDREPALGFVYSDLCLLHGDGSVSPPVLKPHQKLSGHILDALIEDCFIYPSTVMVRRTLLEAVGRFEESFSISEDYDLWLRLAQRAPAGFIGQPLVLVRRHPTNISGQRELETYQNAIAALERLQANYTLSRRQRLHLRLALARMHIRTGLVQTEQGETLGARQHFVRALRLNPLQRRGWQLLLDDLGSRRP